MRQLTKLLASKPVSTVPQYLLQSAPVAQLQGRQFSEAIANERARINQVAANTSSSLVARAPETVINTNLNTSTDEDSDNFVMNLDEVEDELSLTYDENFEKSKLLLNFKKYCLDASKVSGFWTREEESALELLQELRRTSAPLGMYEVMLAWHLRRSGKLESRESVTRKFSNLTKKKLHEKPRIMFNRPKNRYSQISEIVLPHSKSRAKIVWNHAQNVIESLLTDPRIRDEDYLWFGDNPISPPPDSQDYIGDLNTGKAHAESYHKCITQPGKQVLLPVLFYIDGASTGHFADLPITAVKISLGIFTRKAREKDYFWKTLGFLPKPSKHKSRGRRLAHDSHHIEALIDNFDNQGEEGLLVRDGINKAQDLHTMLAVILKSYIELQNTGFYWDLVYKKRVYKNVEFVLFTPFLKLDSDEAEKLCGKCTSRTSEVAQSCRCCMCPTEDSDNYHANYPMKTKEQIQSLIEAKNDDALQKMSQHSIDNAFYPIRFGAHNNQGVHGACPMEMLHALLLGIFKYVRDCFFEQLGATSKLADDINSLSRRYGEYFARQSQRDMPKCKFANGIKKGKLMAKEYPGILLCLSAVLRSSYGTTILRKKRGFFRQEGILQDWLSLTETLLQWEMWLKKDKLNTNLVKRSERKHRYVMYLIKKIGRRTKGMGLKVTKFHTIIHYTQDIVNFGAPMEFDTGSNESGHKATKKAAKLTQKAEETFDEQTHIRLEEVELLELANQHKLGRPLWHYPCGYEHETKTNPITCETKIGGAEIRVHYNAQLSKNCATLLTRCKEKSSFRLEQDLIDYVAGLQDVVKSDVSSVILRTMYKREGIIFRADSNYRGSPWRDWAVMRWASEEPGQEDQLVPCRLLGFVDLSAISSENEYSFNGQYGICSGIYCISQEAEYVEPNERSLSSELFKEVEVTVGGYAQEQVTSLECTLVSVDSVDRQVAVVPDIGGQANRYFEVADRSTWARMFEDWLKEPHTNDAFYESDDDSAQSHVSNYNTNSDSSEPDTETSDEEEVENAN